MATVKTTLTFNCKGNSYTIKQPTVGKIIDIEMMKAQLTNGNYGRMVGNFNEMSVMSLDMVDMFAHFRILCPEFIKDLQTDNWADLDPFDAVEILKAYNEQFKPWYTSFSEKLVDIWKNTTESLIEDEK
jgi:hypothetical protein